MRTPRGIVLALALAACAPLPDIDAELGPPPPGDDYPALLPIAELQAIDAGIPPATEEEAAALEARANALRARAARLSSQ